MPFDAVTLMALRRELDDRCLGGRVQRVLRPNDAAIGLEVYAGQRWQLLLSADPQRPGIYLPEAKLRRGAEKPSPLEQLLRKYVRGARLTAIQQPHLERVLRFQFSGAEGRVDLLCEIMGRLSNLILVDEAGEVMDALRRVPASINRYRTILPHRPYVPPPPQKKRDPLTLSPQQLLSALRDQEGPLFRRLVAAVGAISPPLAREIVFRALGSLDVAPVPTLDGCRRMVATILDLLAADRQPAGWLAYRQRSGERRAYDFFPYEPLHQEDRQACEDLFAAINGVQAAVGQIDPYRQVRQRLHDLVAEQIKKQSARRHSLQQSLVPEDELSRLQASGTAILSMAWAIEPGQPELRVDLEELGIEHRPGVPAAQAIPLDPDRSPSENAQSFFREYRRLQSAGAQVPALIAEAERELAYLAQLDADIDLAEDRAQLDEVEQTLSAAGYLRKRKKNRSLASQPLRLRAPDGTLILVGRNSRQNDQVTFRLSSPDDLWLHAHGVPGSHVIIRSGGGALSEETLLIAARLAAYYSRGRGESRLRVDYAPRRHVRPIRKGRPGMVTYTHEETLVVEPTLLEGLLDGPEDDGA